MKPLIVSAVLAAAGSLHAAPLTAQHTVGDLLAMPAFAPFAERLLPWDGRPADKNLPLSQLGRLMPYHSAVNTADILGALNGLQQRAVQGQSVFYELYSSQERAADPAKAYTGLFFYPGKTGAPFALIAPGGGFQYVGTLHEGLPLARRIAEAGYPAFVVKYRAGQGQQAATQDMARWPLSAVMPVNWALPPTAIPCGAHRPAHAWRQASAATVPPPSVQAIPPAPPP